MGVDAVATEPLRHARDRVVVAHPARRHVAETLEQDALDATELGLAELRRSRSPDLAAERLGHRLHAVTDAEHGHAEREDRGIERRGTGLVDRRGAAGEDDAERVATAELVDRRVVREDLGEDAQLADPAGDQLRVLRAEVEDDQRPLGRLGVADRPLDRPRLCLTHPTFRVATVERC